VDLYEYQGKQYFARFGIPISPGGVADTVDEAVARAEAAGYPVVVKAQVKVGGRGKAGGIQLADDATPSAVTPAAILGMDIHGHTVHRLWIENASDIAREYYASFTLDRGAKLHLCMVSAKGGVEIEEVAATDPEAISRLHVDPVDGLSRGRRPPGGRGRTGPRGPGPGGRPAPEALHLLRRGRLRPGRDQPPHPHHRRPGPRPRRQGHPGRQRRLPPSRVGRLRRRRGARRREKLAKEKGLNYIGLSGSVGIIANGAGLAMSTLDVVTQVGGTAANFLDIGGGANADVMAAALDVINSDTAVRAIFVNIFGGITRVDEVANGVVEALAGSTSPRPSCSASTGPTPRRAGPSWPPISRRTLIMEPTMLDAARRAVALAGLRREVMSIFVDENTKVIVQGLTGGQGRFHGLRNRDYGTQVVAGVTPGKGGTDVDGVPVFDTVAEAVEATGADASFVVVPPSSPPTPSWRRPTGGITFIVCITEGIPAQDEALFYNRLRRDHPGPGSSVPTARGSSRRASATSGSPRVTSPWPADRWAS
jgi:succinyl-CoA synthetase beta subunit